jgi:hypothetical protein
MHKTNETTLKCSPTQLKLTMKQTAPASLGPFTVVLSFALVLAAHSCTTSSTDDPEIFPSLYRYQQLDFKPSKFYVLTSTTYTEIGAAGMYVSHDAELEDELDIDNWDFEIEQVELLDEARLRAYFFPHLGIVPADTVVSYTRNGNRITFGFETPLMYPYTFELDADGGAARVSLLAVQNSYKLPSGNTDYSPVDIVLFDTDPVASVIAQRRDQYNLQPGDTVAVNYSAYLYLKQ